MAHKTKAAIYKRISKDYERTGDALARQEEDARYAIQHNKWELFRIYEDDSISGYSGKRRDDYEQMLRDFHKGKFEYVVCYRLDRLTRDAVAFAHAIEELKETRLKILTTDDGRVYDLSTQTGLADAMRSAADAQMESAIKSARQVRANKQRARQGHNPKGRRLFGYDRKGNPIESEAEIVRNVFRLFLAGTSINAIMRSLSGEAPIEGLPKMTRPSRTRNLEANEKRSRENMRLLDVPEDIPWNRTSVRDMLQNPAYAGYIVRTPWREHRRNPLREHSIPIQPPHFYIVRDDGDEPIMSKDRPGIVDLDVFWAVQDKLDDPRRRTNHVGNERKYLGSGLFLCCECGKPLSASSASYRCDGHVSRRCKKVDEFVIETAKACLGSEDIRHLLPKTENQRLAEIHDEMAQLYGRIAQVQTDYDDGQIRAADMTRARDKLEAKLAALASERSRLTKDSAIGSLVGYDDPVAEFEKMDLGRKREVIAALMTVTLHPHQTGNHSFDGSDVEIKLKY